MSTPAAIFLVHCDISEPETRHWALNLSGTNEIELPGTTDVGTDVTLTAELLRKEHTAVENPLKSDEQGNESVVISAKSVETSNNTVTNAPLSEKIANVIFGAGRGEFDEMITAVPMADEYDAPVELSGLDSCNDIE